MSYSLVNIGSFLLPSISKCMYPSLHFPHIKIYILQCTHLKHLINTSIFQFAKSRVAGAWYFCSRISTLASICYPSYISINLNNGYHESFKESNDWKLLYLDDLPDRKSSTLNRFNLAKKCLTYWLCMFEILVNNFCLPKNGLEQYNS